MNLKEIKKEAERELYLENKRRLIDMEKEKMKAKKWWHKLMPFKIIITRRE